MQYMFHPSLTYLIYQILQMITLLSHGMQDAISLMQTKLKVITTWLKDSGLKVNDSKTELCLFYRADAQPIQIEINGSVILSKPTINVLGVIFDSKLQWGSQIEGVIKKSNKAKHAIYFILFLFYFILVTSSISRWIV